MADARRKRSDDLPSKPLRRNGGFGLVRSNRYLLLIALMVLTFNLVNSLGEYILGQIDVADAKAAVAAGVITSSQMRSAIGAFYGISSAGSQGSF